MKIKSVMRKSVLLSLLFAVGFTYAGSWRIAAVGDIGALSSKRNTQQITLAPGLVNKYVQSNTTNLLWGAGGRVSYDLHIKDKLHLLMGLQGEYFRSWHKAVKGVVHPLINVGNNFDVLDYKYQLQSYLLLANEQWLWVLPGSPFDPYLSAGAGVVWNKLYNYSEKPPFGSTASPMLNPFRSHTKAQFAYSVGVGFDSSIRHVGLQFGYQFFALGRAKLGTTKVQSSDNVLQTSRLYLNMFELTFYYAS